MTDRGQIPLGDVAAGDSVASMDFATGEWVLNRVRQHFRRSYTGDVVTVRVRDDEIRVTAGHPFWVVDGVDLDLRPCPTELMPDEDLGERVPGRWMDSHELRVGDVLLSQDGRQLVVDDVQVDWEDEFEVCNLQVDGDPNYAVGLNALLVHNWCKILEHATGVGREYMLKVAGMIRPHAHHIVMKGFWSHVPWTAKWNNMSKDILQKVGIDGLYDEASAWVAARAARNGGEKLHNLTWARNWDHSGKYAQSVYNKLSGAFDEAILKGTDPRQAVVDAMEEIAEVLANGHKFRFGV